VAARGAGCTVVAIHEPAHSVGAETTGDRLATVWGLLAAHGVEAVLSGNDHNYQRWQALNAAGAPDPNGVTQFVVGTGGHDPQRAARADPRLATDLHRQHLAGALRLELWPDKAVFAFVATDGTVLDDGELPCHSGPADAERPRTPRGLATAAPFGDEVWLRWEASTDDVGVVAYEVFRDGERVATTGPGTAYADTGLEPGRTYRYAVRARDAAGRVSGRSRAATVTTPTDPPLLAEGFEDGSLARWSTAGAVSLVRDAASGRSAARLLAEGAPAYARAALPRPQRSVYVRLRVNLARQGPNPVALLRLRTGTASLLGLTVSAGGRLGYHDDVSGRGEAGQAVLPMGEWRTVEVAVRIDDDGGADRIAVWLDGVPVPELTGTVELGDAPVAVLQLGDSSPGDASELVVDDVVVLGARPPEAGG
jgi:hypothetical protein